VSGQEMAGLEPVETEEVRLGLPERTIESVVDLLREIIHPVVEFSKDQHEMALRVIEQNQSKAAEALRLLAGDDDYEVVEDEIERSR